MRNVKWGAKEIQALQDLYAAGKTSNEIARELGRSNPSVTNKIGDLGLVRGAREFEPSYQPTDLEALAAGIRKKISRGSRKFGIIELADEFDTSPKRIREAVEFLKAGRSLIKENDGTIYLASPDAGGFSQIPLEAFGSNEIAFGVASDKHLASKYERLDALNALYDVFQSEGITQVYDCGNWIDGEAQFNKRDIRCHGLDNQLEYWATHHPRREGITTHFIAGDDHEGWYHQREGIEIGKHAQHVAEELGRDDLKYLSYMEHDIVVPAPEGETRIRLIHAGGGSAYAISYTSQKLIESLSGGDKPEILLVGHYHKAEYIHYRNVHCFQAGCLQDQTPFMRKKRLSAHVGGWIIRATQAADGSIQRIKSEYINFYDMDYYRKWAHQG